MRSSSRGLGLVVGTATLVAGTMVGCLGGDDNTSPPQNGVDASIPGVDGSPISRPDTGGSDSSPGNDATLPDSGQPDANVADTNAPDTNPATALVRVAWFVTGGGVTQRAPRKDGVVPIGPAYDVCVAPHGTGQWQGPLQAAVGGLQTFDVTSYHTVLAGQYDVRIVFPPVGSDAGAATCNDVVTLPSTDGGAPSTAEYTNLPVIPGGAALTIAFVNPPLGSAQPPGVVPLVDEVTPTSKVHARFVNVSQIAGTADYGAGGGVAFAPWFSGVDSTTYVDKSAGADPNGYRDVDPIDIDTSIQSGGADQASTNAMTFAAGDVVTAFASSNNGDGFVLVTCHDAATNPSSPQLGACTVGNGLAPPAQGQVRVGDFIADDPGPVDVCIKYKQEPAFGAPIVLATQGSDAGVSFGSVTPYLSVHGGFAYDVRLVAAGSASCATAIVPDGALTLPLPTGLYDARATLAVAGYVNPPDGGAVTLPEAGAPVDAAADVDGGPTSPELTTLGLTYAMFLDADMTGTSPALRVIHVDAQDPVPMKLDNGNWTFDNVPYGGFGTPSGIDARGYLTVPAGFGNPGLSTGDFFAAPVQTGDFDTAYIVPGSSQGRPALIVYCTDSAFQTTSCSLESPEQL